MMHVVRYISIIVLSMFLFLSCDQSKNKNIAYYHYLPVRNAVWDKDRDLVFEIDSSLIDAGQRYDISIGINNTIDYSFCNIWLFVRDNIQSDTLLNTEQHEYILADETGRWLGDGFAAIYQSDVLYKRGILFAEKKNYRFRITHGMHTNPLKGIERIGLRIEKSAD